MIVNLPISSPNREPRVSKKLREEDQGAKGGAKGKQAKKEDKKAAKGGKQVEVVEKKEDRPLPKSEDHKMNEIYEFLGHMEEERIQELLAKHAGYHTFVYAIQAHLAERAREI